MKCVFDCLNTPGGHLLIALVMFIVILSFAAFSTLPSENELVFGSFTGVMVLLRRESNYVSPDAR